MTEKNAGYSNLNDQHSPVQIISRSISVFPNILFTRALSNRSQFQNIDEKNLLVQNTIV